MAKDYVLFLHGVNVRESLENERNQIYTYADDSFKLVNEVVQQQSPTRRCIKVPLYWGDVNRAALKELLGILSQGRWA